MSSSWPNRLAKSIARPPFVRRILVRIPWFRERFWARIYWDWGLPHPIDALYGIDTSGLIKAEELSLPGDALRAEPQLAAKIVGYIGSQPSIVRRTLATLPDLRDYSFVDIGCGKGRVTAVASEFSFREIIGVELSPELAGIAEANARAIAARYPSRPPIRIVRQDATTFVPRNGKVVIYIYHAFHDELMARFLTHIEAQIGSSITHAFLVYYNPVCARLFDASAKLRRWLAAEIPYDTAELGYGPDRFDTVIVWQGGESALASPHNGREREIVLLDTMKTGLAP